MIIATDFTSLPHVAALCAAIDDKGGGVLPILALADAMEEAGWPTAANAVRFHRPWCTFAGHSWFPVLFSHHKEMPHKVPAEVFAALQGGYHYSPYGSDTLRGYPTGSAAFLALAEALIAPETNSN